MTHRHNDNIANGGRNPSPIYEEREESELMTELRSAPSKDVELVQPLYWWRVWLHRITGFFTLLKSQTIIPDVFKKNPYMLYFVLSALVLMVLLPIKMHFWMLVLGLILGYAYAVPTVVVGSNGREAGASALLNFLMAPLKYRERSEREVIKLAISPGIDAELDYFLDSVLAEVINPWFVQLCMSGEMDFQSCVRSTVNAAIMNLCRYGSIGNKDAVTLILYGVTNAMIVHMEEYRMFEESKLPLERFINSGRTKRNHHKSFLEQLEHTRQIAGLLLKKLLPKQESRSIILTSLLKEIASSTALNSMIEKLSDPDFINQEIIKLLSDPKNTLPILAPGWNMVIVKVLRGKNLPTKDSARGVYLVIHGGGRKAKTRQLRDANQLWNEIFRFKLSDMVRANFKMYIQLCQFNYMGQDESKGYAKLIPDFSNPLKPTTLWLRFNVKPGVDQPVNRPPEVLIELTTLVGGESHHEPCEHFEDDQAAAIDRANFLDSLPESSSKDSPSPESFPGHLDDGIISKPSSYAEPSLGTNASDHGLITLEAAMQNNELFMELLEYLESVKAPPYLQFMMNVDALKQFTAMSLGIENKTSNAIDEYFRTGLPLLPEQLEQLRMIKHDAADVFGSHFAELARYRVPLDPGMQQELQEWVSRSDRVDSSGRYVGGPVGPNIFIPAYKWVANVLEEVYFPKFKSSDVFKRFLDRAQFATLNFAIDDDRMSILSHDSSAIPPNWAYGDQTSVERQQKAALSSTGFRSRNGSFDDLAEITADSGEGLDGDEYKKIAAEITLARRKLFQIDEQIEKNSKQLKEEPGALRRLEKERKSLSVQIEGYIKLMKEMEVKHEGHFDDLWLDLKNATVKVRFAGQAPNDHGDVLSTLMTTVENVLSAVSEPVFDIEISIGGSTSIVTRSFTEFARLHSLLKKQFPKVGMISFPEQGLLQSNNLDASLQAYLQMLVSDEFVRQSITLREFTTLEGAFDSENTPAMEMMRKKMKDVFKSATTMIGGHPNDQRRSHFYETRERHTSINVNETEAPRASPAFYSVTDLRDTNGVDGKGSSAPGAATPTKRRESVLINGERARLSQVPSVELPPTPKKTRHVATKASGTKAAPKILDELSDAEIEMLVETFFAFIIETFDLREPNQWLRRKLLGIFKQLLKQAYGDTLNKIITDLINNAFSESSVVAALRAAHSALFPDGIFIAKRPPPVPRTEEEKFATMVEARTLFLCNIPDILQNVAGRYNAVCGMTRIFHSLQHKELNKALLFACIDIVIKLLFSDKPTS